MDMLWIVERLGEAPAAALMGLLTGAVFGVAAQRSRFCLRAATVEFARGGLGPAVTVWLLTFSTALVWVQAGALAGLIDPREARIMAVPGSWSGAMIGGLMFGAGMVLARGCSGRLLVLAATGNLRALVAGLIFAVTAQVSLGGWLAPLRDRLAALWTTSGGRNVDLLARLPEGAGLMAGLGIAALALALARRNRIGAGRLVFASGVGFAVALGWALTTALSQVSFDPVTIQSATFTGPSARTLMFLLDRSAALEFEVGMVPGVALGALLAARAGGDLGWQGFDGAAAMRRSILGAVLMGFGGMLAGGCAIGAGVTGGSIFAATAWVALMAIWGGAVATDALVDRPRIGTLARA